MVASAPIEYWEWSSTPASAVAAGLHVAAEPSRLFRYNDTQLSYVFQRGREWKKNTERRFEPIVSLGKEWSGRRRRRQVAAYSGLPTQTALRHWRRGHHTADRGLHCTPFCLKYELGWAWWDGNEMPAQQGAGFDLSLHFSVRQICEGRMASSGEGSSRWPRWRDRWSLMIPSSVVHGIFKRVGAWCHLGLVSTGAFVSLLCFPAQSPSGQAPSSQTFSMHSVVVWLRAHPEPG
jgi:hypothetical protein